MIRIKTFFFKEAVAQYLNLNKTQTPNWNGLYLNRTQTLHRNGLLGKQNFLTFLNLFMDLNVYLKIQGPFDNVVLVTLFIFFGIRVNKRVYKNAYNIG